MITIYDAKNINKQLYSTAPFPEFGGCFRETNTLVLGAKFETIDYFEIPQEMKNLDKEIQEFMDNPADDIIRGASGTIKKGLCTMRAGTFKKSKTDAQKR